MKKFPSDSMTILQTEFCDQNGQMQFAGIHLIIELWGAEYLDDIQAIERIMRKAIQSCGVTLLSLNLHEFSSNGAVSGVGILQESHMSIHTWPEYEYAAMDLFVCGSVDPYQAITVLKSEFHPKQIQISEIKRGIII